MLVWRNYFRKKKRLDMTKIKNGGYFPRWLWPEDTRFVGFSGKHGENGG